MPWRGGRAPAAWRRDPQ
uniref:Uncharacterized protein n=1 Tax=Arundo donax TaxID=35708 RepID=A0A0A8Y1M4_ARUDO